MVSAINARGKRWTTAFLDQAARDRRSAPSALPALDGADAAGVVGRLPHAFTGQALQRRGLRRSGCGRAGAAEARSVRDRTAITTPSLVRSATRFRRQTLQLAGILDQHHAIGCFGGPRRAARWLAWSYRVSRLPPATRMFFARRTTAARKRLGLVLMPMMPAAT